MRALIFLFLIAPILLLSQNEFNQLNSQGLKTGPWRKYFNGTKKLRYEGQFENGKEIGTFKFYTKEGSKKPAAIKTFNKTTGIAEVVFYTSKGKKISEGKMNGKDKIGKWIYYHKVNGNIMMEENYIANVLKGQKKVYHENGNLLEISTYDNNKLNGLCKKYSDKGKLIEELHYTNNLLDGEASYYYTSGAIKSKGKYKQDRRYGNWEYYTPDGKIDTSKNKKTKKS